MANPFAHVSEAAPDNRDPHEAEHSNSIHTPQVPAGRPFLLRRSLDEAIDRLLLPFLNLPLGSSAALHTANPRIEDSIHPFRLPPAGLTADVVFPATSRRS